MLFCPFIAEFLGSPLNSIDQHFVRLIMDLHLHNEQEKFQGTSSETMVNL